MRTFLAAALVAISLPALAAETTYTRNCTSFNDGVNAQYNCTTSINRPAPPPEPFYRGPATAETVRVVMPTRASGASPVAPIKVDPNFCGPGFRFNPREGCELAK